METPEVAAPATTESTPAPDTSGAINDTADYNPDADLDSRILARLEGNDADTSDEPPAETPVKADETAETTTETKVAPATDDEDDLAKELGIDPKKNNKIPYAKVQKIWANKEKKLTEAHTAALTERDTKLKATEDRIAKVDSVEKIMATDRKRYLKLLADVDPEYAQLLSPVLNGATAASDPQQRRDSGDMPKPDYDLGNGQFTYSEKGLIKLLEWNAAKAEERAEARVLKRLDPVLKRHEADALIEAEQPKFRAKMEKLRNRPKFMENIEAIHAKVRQGADADDAYWEVVGPQLTEDANTMRAKLIEEQKKLPKSTSVGVASTVAAPVDSEAAMNSRILARLKGMPADG